MRRPQCVFLPDDLKHWDCTQTGAVHTSVKGQKCPKRLRLQACKSTREGQDRATSCRSPTSGRFHCSPHRFRFLAIKQRWFSLCVTGEDKVARFDLIVAGEAGFHERLVARFSVLESERNPNRPLRCTFLCP
jgi:hypothetical protein